MRRLPPDVAVARFVPLAFVLLSFPGCKGGTEPPTDKPGQVMIPEKPVEVGTQADSQDASTGQPAPESHWDGRIIVDTSQSMEGFTKVKNAAVVNVHQVLQDSFAESRLPSLSRCLIGSELDCDKAPDDVKSYGNKSLYRSTVSRLDLALRRNEVPAVSDPDHPPMPDLIDDARLTVIVTDGMQAASGIASGTSTTTGAGCQAGADPTCITSLLSGRVNEGYGAWIMQAALPFKGIHYAERQLDQNFLGRVESHLAEANLNPRWNGIEFSFKRPSGTPDRYPYEGFKPLLFIVLSRDIALGRQFVDTAVRRLRDDPIRPGKMSDEDAVQSVELAPLSPPSYKFSRIERLPDAEQRDLLVGAENPEGYTEFVLKKSEESPKGVLGDLWCGSTGAGFVYAIFVRDDSNIGLDPYFSNPVKLDGPLGPPLPGNATAGIVEVASRSAYRLGINCSALNDSKTTILYEMSSHLVLDADATASEWWTILSSDNTYEMPERIYGLKELVLGVLALNTKTEKKWGKVALRVEKEEEE